MHGKRRALDRWPAWLAAHELAALLICAPFLLFPLVAPLGTALALVAIPCLWVSRWRARGRLTEPTPLNWPILGLLLALCVGFLASADRSLSLSKATGMVLGVAVYYALASRPDAWALRWWLPWLGAGVAAVGLLGTDWVAFKVPLLGPLYQHLPRLIRGVPPTMEGGFHPNEVGGAMAMCIPLALAALLGPRPQHQRGGILGRIEDAASARLLLGLALLLMGALLLLTQSRAAMGALAVALWVMLVWRWPAMVALGSIPILGLLVAGWVLAGDQLLASMLSLPGAQTWQARPEIWANALRVIRDYPLTGIGLNAFAPVSWEHYVYLIAPHTWDFVHAHNIWLQVAVDLGLLGFVSLITLLVGLFAIGWRTRRAAPTDGSIWWVGGLMAVVGAYLAFGLIDAITLGAKPSLLVWVAAGLLMGRYRGSVHNDTRAASRPMLAAATGIGLALLLAGSLLIAPVRAMAWSNLGRVALNQRRIGPAVAMLERAVANDHSSTSAQYSLGEAYLAAGREADALLAWRSGGVEAKALANRGEMLRRQGDLEQAARWQGWALALDDALSDAWYGLGLVREAQGRARDALDAFRRALARDNYYPGEPGAPDRVTAASVGRATGALLIRMGQPGDAAELFRDMLLAEPADVAARFNLAQALSLAGEYAQAEGELLDAAKALEGQRGTLPPLSYRDLRLELSVALTTNANRRGDLAAAQKWAQVAKAIEPRHPFPYADLAGLYLARGDYDQAIAECQAFLSFQADGSGAFHYLLGLASVGQGDLASAEEALRAATERRADVAAFSYRLAEVLAARGNVEQAAAVRTQAEAQGPDVPLQITGHYRLLND